MSYKAQKIDTQTSCRLQVVLSVLANSPCTKTIVWLAISRKDWFLRGSISLVFLLVKTKVAALLLSVDNIPCLGSPTLNLLDAATLACAA